MPLTKKQKDKQLEKHKSCYVCEGLNLKHHNFKGYERADIQFDHYLAQSLVGDRQKDLVENQLPVHAAKNGDDYLSANYSNSTKRNCHKGKGNKFSGEEWIDFINIHRQVQEIDFSDDLFKQRRATDKQYEVDIKWGKDTAEFQGVSYPIMEQIMGKEDWASFSTVVPPSLLWVDHDVQTRPADKKRMADLAWHLRTKPLLSPILCRYSDNKLKVFDGNHRLCAFILARENHAVPVTIFRGPEPNRFLEVVAEAHDKLTQKKYQYSDKALKYSGISAAELADCISKHGDQATEVQAWAGLTRADVRVRLIGRVAQEFDDRKKDWRKRWKALGVSDASFSWMIGYYSKTSAAAEPFSSKGYFRESEVNNLVLLFTAFDDELFKKLDTCKRAKASLKTKWWKLAHKRFRTQLSQLVKVRLELQNTPDNPAYSPEWDDYIKSELHKAVAAWRESVVWAGDTTANNEPEVDAALTEAGFTESYLFK